MQTWRFRYTSRDAPIVFLAVLLALWLFTSRVLAVRSYLHGQLDFIGSFGHLLENGEAKCLLNFCEVSTLPRRFTSTWLLICYGVAAGLFVLFFVWESGPCHHHRSTEAVYIQLLVFLVTWASETWERSLTDKMDGTSSGAIEVRSAMQWAMAMFMMMRYCQIDSFQLDFRARAHTARRFAECHTLIEGPKGLERPLRGLRCTDELKQLMFDIVGYSESFVGRLQEIMLPLVFVLYMVEELGLAYPEQLNYWLVLGSNIFYWISDAFNAYWILWVLVWRQGLVHRCQVIVRSLIRAEDASSLRYVLWHVSVASLIGIGGEYVESELMQALENGMLDTTSKAVIADAYMQFGMRTATAQRHVCKLILSCKGMELTKFKTLMDGSGGYNNLYKLIYQDISDEELRHEVLEHIQLEAEAAMCKVGQYLGTKVLSDVDDTLLSSGGKFPAGCDTKVPKHVVYPGCTKLFEFLDNSYKPGMQEPSCNLVFLSARPHIYKGIAERQSYDVFGNLVDAELMHRLPTLLPGRLTSGLEATFTFCVRKTDAWKRVGEDKFKTYTNFSKLYPEYQFVFCGDDGQGDLYAGQKMLREDAENKLKAVVIHRVLREGQKPLELASSRAVAEDGGLLEQSEEKRLFFHRTYVGAALSLHQADPTLISTENLVEIAHTAISQLDRARVSNVKFLWGGAESDLCADLKRVQEVLHRKGVNASLELRQTWAIMELAGVQSSSSSGEESEEEE
eukprot:TRINITY_DN17149_c0_g1_i2.p1 TRINITY_DN17149_c0_g1~~TRINITY_DN17149_c0_g1_i2.p1  ORF type:complete len:735 (+),score=153.62 TRINITY_DN17149_c0_g1_i2:46-2250(+)